MESKTKVNPASCERGLSYTMEDTISDGTTLPNKKQQGKHLQQINIAAPLEQQPSGSSCSRDEASFEDLKSSTIREVLATLPLASIAKEITSAQESERRHDDNGQKKFHSSNNNDIKAGYESVSISGDRYWPIDDTEPNTDTDEAAGGLHGSLRNDVSFVATKSQTDNMSDLFPQRKKRKGSDPSSEQQLIVADEILEQIDKDMSCSETLGEPIIDGLVARIIKQFKLHQTKITKEF